MHNLRVISTSITLFLGVFVAAVAIAAGPAAEGQISIIPSEVKWTDAPAIGSGTKLAVLEGDPKLAESFTMRIKFPANFKVAITYDRDTVLSPAFQVGGTRVCLPAITPAVRGWGYTVFERTGYRGATDPPDEMGVTQSWMALGKACLFNLEIALMPIGIFPKDLARAGETAYGSITCKRCETTHRVFL